MLKVLIYPADKRLINDTPYLFHPKGYYRVVVILGFNDKTKIYHTAVRIPYDLLPGNKLEFVHQYRSCKMLARNSPFMSRCVSDSFHKQFETFIADHIKRMVEIKRKGENLFTHDEVEHLGEDRIRRDRRDLAKDLKHWNNVATNINGTERTRAFGRQMGLLVQGQLNHYDTFVGEEWQEVIRAIDGVIVF